MCSEWPTHQIKSCISAKRIFQGQKDNNKKTPKANVSKPNVTILVIQMRLYVDARPSNTKKKTQIQTLYAWQRIWTGILLSPSPTYSCLCTLFFPYPMNQHPHSGQLWTQKWNSHLVRTQSLTLFHLTLSLPLGCHMRYVAKHAATGCWNANFLHKFQLLVQSGAKLSSKDEHFWPLQHLF